MNKLYITPEQLAELFQKRWSLYAPVFPNDCINFEMAYWAVAPKNKDDVFLCNIAAFDKEPNGLYHTLVPETWAEAQITNLSPQTDNEVLHRWLNLEVFQHQRSKATINIIVQLLKLLAARSLAFLWIVAVALKRASLVIEDKVTDLLS